MVRYWQLWWPNLFSGFHLQTRTRRTQSLLDFLGMSWTLQWGFEAILAWVFGSNAPPYVLACFHLEGWAWNSLALETHRPSLLPWSRMQLGMWHHVWVLMCVVSHALLTNILPLKWPQLFPRRCRMGIRTIKALAVESTC